jgi:hypothetical protein
MCTINYRNLSAQMFLIYYRWTLHHTYKPIISMIIVFADLLSCVQQI